MERKIYLLDVIKEIEEDIAEAKKGEYDTEELETFKKEYMEELEALGGYDEEEAKKVYNEKIKEANMYMAAMFA